MSDTDRDLGRARKLARVLDHALVDPLLGLLLPGGGDLAGSALGLYLVGVAVKKRLPLVVIARMLVNLAVDALIGFIPLVGDLFDFAFRANRRNLALLEARHEARRARPGDWLVVAGAALLFAAALALPFVVMIWALRAVF